MSPVSYLSSVARATAALFSLVILVVAVSTSPSPSLAADEKPVAVKDVVRATAGEWTRFKVLSNDYDPDGTKVRLKRVKQPNLGKARVRKGKKIKYRPNQSARGRDVIRYVIRDRNGRGKRAKGKVIVDVQGPTPSMAELCDDPGVILCEDFETNLAQTNKNRCAAGNEAQPDLCPRIQSDMAFEGNGSLQLTTDGGKYEDVSGIVSFPYSVGATTPVFMNIWMKFGDGFIAFDDAGGFPGSNGVKWFILAGDGDTCSFHGGEMVIARNHQQIASMYHSCGPWVRNNVPPNDFDFQPKNNQTPTCLYSNMPHEGGPACVDVVDDRWYNFEMAVFPANGSQRGRVKLWIDGVLVVDWVSDANPSSGFPWKAEGPFDEVFLTNYQTGFNRAHPGQYWRIWYDNLIVSTECITSC